MYNPVNKWVDLHEEELIKYDEKNIWATEKNTVYSEQQKWKDIRKDIWKNVKKVVKSFIKVELSYGS